MFDMKITVYVGLNASTIKRETVKCIIAVLIGNKKDVIAQYHTLEDMNA